METALKWETNISNKLFGGDHKMHKININIIIMAKKRTAANSSLVEVLKCRC